MDGQISKQISNGWMDQQLMDGEMNQQQMDGCLNNLTDRWMFNCAAIALFKQHMASIFKMNQNKITVEEAV